MMKFTMDYKWVALSVTTVGTLMSTLNTTIVLIALPTILKDLQASIIHGIWIITGYVLMMTILLVVIGRLADLYGRVKLYNLGLAIFTAASLLCALSSNGEQLIIFRFIQGGAAALLLVNCFAIITDAFPKSQLGLGLGMNLMAYNLGAIAGYSLSGIIMTYFGWRSIFLINLPLGLFGTILGYKLLKEIRVRPLEGKFDYAGSILYCLALTTILIGMTIGNPISVRNITIIASGIIFFIFVIFIELRQKYPTLDLTLFKIRMFTAGTTASFLNSIAFGSGPFLISFYLQLVQGYSALITGVMLIPMEIVVLVLAPIVGRLSDKYGSRILSSLGLALNASAIIWFSALHERSAYSAVIVGLVIFGMGRALFSTPNASSIMSSVPAEKRGVANGIRATLVQTSTAISVPFALLLMTLVMPYDQLSQIASNSQLINPQQLPDFLKAIKLACLILGLINLLAIIPSLLRGPKEIAIPSKPGN
jgi:EmrB/QacA subfamily drug resistance transporter